MTYAPLKRCDNVATSQVDPGRKRGPVRAGARSVEGDPPGISKDSGRRGFVPIQAKLIVGDVNVPRGASAPDIDVAWTHEGQTTVRLGPKRLVDVTAEGTVLLRK